MKQLITLLCLCVFWANAGHAQSTYFTTIAAGSIANHTLAIKSDATLWAWGYNNNGQLGDGTFTNKSVPFQVGTATNWASIATGSSHSLGITTDGKLWAWGNNVYGQVGDGTINTVTGPEQIGTATNWVSIAAGLNHSLGITTDGKLWAWGRNAFGQLGDGTTTDKFTPTQIGNATDWVGVSAGSTNSLGITADGKLWAWGSNGDGQLGDGTTIDKHIPTQIGTATNWASISAGRYHSLGITADGKLWAWGYNLYGELGDGTTTNKSVPTQIGTATNWVSVTAGAYHSLSITADGKLWAWGGNAYGQLGDGTTTDKNTPTQIGTATNWVSLAAGYYHSLGITTDGKDWAWGYNTYGQLGDGTTTNKSSATQINIGTVTTLLGTATMQQGQYNFYNNGCTTIAAVGSTRASLTPIRGSTTATVWLETTQPATYVSRHYQITPANAASHTICTTVAENTNLVLTAPAGYVITDINFASYGTPTGNCTSGFTTGACSAANSVSVVSGLSIGKNSVTIPATFATFGVDPCNGTLKSLAVQATYGQTGRVTLYFLQSEFDAFNGVNPTKLPTSSSDGTGISNLLIEKRPGISSDGSGLPSTYSGTPITINPADGDIVWNSAVNRWEVSFDVTGFSGFFVKTQAAVLPLKLIGFTGSKVNGANILNWNTTNEINTKQFIIEWSMDAANWNILGATPAKGDMTDSYTYDHANVPSGKIFYRLKMIDQDGQFTYSNIIWLNGNNNIGIVIYPNPVKDALNLNMGNSLLNTTALLTNLEGKLLQRITITANQQQINVTLLPSGMYILTFADGTREKFVKE